MKIQCANVLRLQRQCGTNFGPAVANICQLFAEIAPFQNYFRS